MQKGIPYRVHDRLKTSPGHNHISHTVSSRSLNNASSKPVMDGLHSKVMDAALTFRYDNK